MASLASFRSVGSRGGGAGRRPVGRRGLHRHDACGRFRSSCGGRSAGRDRGAAAQRASYRACREARHRARERAGGRARAQRPPLRGTGRRRDHNRRSRTGNVGRERDRGWAPRVRAPHRDADYAAARLAARAAGPELSAGDIRHQPPVSPGGRHVSPAGAGGNAAEPSVGLRRDRDLGRDRRRAARVLRGTGRAVWSRSGKPGLPRRVRARGLADSVFERESAPYRHQLGRSPSRRHAWHDAHGQPELRGAHRTGGRSTWLRTRPPSSRR